MRTLGNIASDMVIALEVLPEILTQVQCLTLWVIQREHMKKLINNPLRELEELHLLKLINYWRRNNDNQQKICSIIGYGSNW